MSSTKRRRGGKQMENAESVNEAVEAQAETVYTPPPPRQQQQEPQQLQQTPRQARMELDRIGDILRRARMERGEALHDISNYLRIRPAFLSALEHSRYDELPADAYVIGFLRTYAAYLDLDEKAATEMYRREMAGRRRKPQLNMPQPISEGRAPTIAVIIAALVAGIFIYAVWYGFSSERAVVNAEPPVIAEEKSEPEKPEIQESENTVIVPSQGAAVSDDLVAETPQLEAEKVEPAVKEIVVKKAETVPLEPVTAKTESVAPEIPLATTNGIEIAAPAPAAKEEKPAAQPEVQNTEQPKPKIFGSTSVRPRIYVRTEKESWLLIADSKGNTVFDRIMKPGEVYNVPNLEGLTLTTGNGGGIVLNVDGADLPYLSPASRVVRAVPLDPDLLKSRNSSE